MLAICLLPGMHVMPGNPELATFLSSHSGEVCTQRGLREGTQAQPTHPQAAMYMLLLSTSRLTRWPWVWWKLRRMEADVWLDDPG